MAVEEVIWRFKPSDFDEKLFWVVLFFGVVALFGFALRIDLFTSPDAPPRELKFVLAKKETRCYIYNLGGFIDWEYLWRIDAKPEVIASVVQQLNLEKAKNVPRAFWQMPPYYWPRSLAPNAMIYESFDFPLQGRGLDGNHYFLLHDKSTNRAYVWYKYNF